MSHLGLADLAAYFAGDHPDEARVEEELLSCGECAALGERVAAITEALRTEIPLVIDHAQLERLVHQGLRVRENPVEPGARSKVAFEPGVDLLVHRLGGLDLRAATRVSLAVRVESSGRSLVELDEAPFDRESGEVLVPCQRHFAALPPDTLMEVRVTSPAGERVARYSILHAF